MEEYKKVIAIDFDGCLSANQWPEIGEPNWDVINRAKAEKDAGAELVLWTCRTGEHLEAAVRACREWGLEFDAVNENTPRLIEIFGEDCRKVCAAEYWDDHAVTVPEKSGWISVNERMPELKPCKAGTAYSEAVVVLTKGCVVLVAVWDGIDWIGAFDYWDVMGEEVTHWMPVLPLPDLPKEV